MISIITPIYNGSQYLEDCLASFARQDQEHCELVLVDDGSTDDSLSICERFSRGRDNVVVVHQENAGQFAAREAGIGQSRGEYLMFLDSDDALRPDAVSRVQSCFSAHPDVQCVCFRFSRGRQETYEENDTVGLSLAGGVYEGELIREVRRALCEGDLNNLCNKAFRSDLVKEALSEVSSQTPVRHGEDLYQLIPIARRMSSVELLEETLYFYRDNDSSTSRKVEKRQIEDLYTVFGYLRSVAALWGSEFELYTETGFNKHLYWCLYGTIASRMKKDVRDEIVIAASAAQRAFHDDSHGYTEVLRLLRLDQRLPMLALSKGRYCLCKAELSFGYGSAQLLSRIK